MVRDIPKPHDPKIKTGPSSSLQGDINEILVGYYTKPGPPNDPFKYFSNKGADPRADFDQKAKKLPLDLYIHEQERAKKMVEAFMDYAYRNKYATSTDPRSVKAVYWTASDGMIEKASGMKAPSKGKGKNPTDILVEFNSQNGRSFLGNSAKSTKQAASGIPFANPGIGPLSSELFGNSSHLTNIVGKMERKMISDPKFRGILPKTWMSMTNQVKKKWQKENEAANVMIKEHYGGPTLGAVRDAVMNKMLSMPWEELTPWLVDFVGGDYMGPQFVKVTGRGLGPYTAALEVPENNKKTIGVRKSHVLLEPMGNTSIRVYDLDGKEIFGIRMKYESQPFSSAIKISGDSVGKEAGYFESISEDPKEAKVKKPTSSGRKRKTKG